MVSFDVVSLFTNIPLTETINTIADYVYDENNDSLPPFKKDIFVKLIYMATQGLFLHKDTVCKQIDGIMMGSPLGPTMANFFMANVVTKLFEETSQTHPKLYLRYVDDIFAVFDDQQSCTQFLNTLNSQHPNIKFTVEKSTGTLAFLDVEIKINENGFDTWIWRKPTSAGLLLNFNAIFYEAPCVKLRNIKFCIIFWLNYVQYHILLQFMYIAKKPFNRLLIAMVIC